jgi:hypothetical protein
MDARIEITIIDEEGEGWTNEPLVVNISDFAHSDGYADRIRKRMLTDVDRCYEWMRQNWMC